MGARRRRLYLRRIRYRGTFQLKPRIPDLYHTELSTAISNFATKSDVNTLSDRIDTLSDLVESHYTNLDNRLDIVESAIAEDIDGRLDVDAVMTTRELARLIERCGLDFKNLPDEAFDDPMGESTGAAVIFGATGGVMEAALRTAVWKLTGETNDSPLEFKEVRGVEGIKEATYEVAGMSVKVAVASGLQNARVIMDKIRAGEADYTFVEIMACPGGCVNGGGQPQVPASVRNFTDIRAERAKALYNYDENMPRRKSHENESVKKLYAEYFGEPNSHRAHEVLHTKYVQRKIHEI